VTSSKCDISDSDWVVIQKVLPAEIYTGLGSRGGRPHACLRRVFCGLLYWVRTGCQWDLIPGVYGSKTTLAKYLKKWEASGAFGQLMSSSLEMYDGEVGIDWCEQVIDGSIKRAPGCSKNTGKNPTDRSKPGTKQMILTEKNGIPLAVVTMPANRSDMKQVEVTLSSIQTKRPSPDQVKQHLSGDKGFDSNENRETANEWGYDDHILKKGVSIKLNKHSGNRWVVERTNSWVNQFRGIHTRRIHRPEIYQAMSLLVCSCIILSKLG
jgi:transposase